MEQNNMENIFEKRYIKGIAVSIGIACIVLAAVSKGWSTLILWVIDYFGISRTFAAKLLSNEGIEQFEQVIFSALCFTVPFIIAAKSANEKVSELIPFKRSEKATALPYFLIGISFCTFANLSVAFAGSFFEGMGIEYSVASSPLPKGTVGFILYLISTAVIPALVEEFACRGIIFGLLKPLGEGFAVIVSAIIFGIVHGNFEQIPFTFLVGLVLGLIRLKTDSVFIAMAVHGFNNLISVVLSYLGEMSSVTENEINIFYSLFMAVSLSLGLFALYLIKNRGDINFKKPVCETGEKQKYIWFFTSPAIIIFIILELLGSLQYFLI